MHERKTTLVGLDSVNCSRGAYMFMMCFCLLMTYLPVDNFINKNIQMDTRGPILEYAGWTGPNSNCV